MPAINRFPFAYAGTVISLINQQDGTFSPPTVISKKASVFSGLMTMNVGDINGGGFGTLGFALPASDGNNAGVIKFRDVDGDGTVDATIAGGQFLGVWPGKGDGTFRAPVATYVGGFATNATSGLTFPVSNHVIDDFDGDGVDDVAFFDTSKRALLFHRGKADGTFVGAPALTNPHGNFPTNGVRIIATLDLDLDDDGEQDIIVSSPWAILSGLNDHHGGFTYRALSPNPRAQQLYRPGLRRVADDQ